MLIHCATDLRARVQARLPAPRVAAVDGSDWLSQSLSFSVSVFVWCVLLPLLTIQQLTVPNRVPVCTEKRMLDPGREVKVRQCVL